MSNSELIEWNEYLGLFPLLEDRNEYQMAVLSAMTASSSKKQFEANDFMITNKKQKVELSGKDLEDYIFKAMG